MASCRWAVASLRNVLSPTTTLVAPSERHTQDRGHRQLALDDFGLSRLQERRRRAARAAPLRDGSPILSCVGNFQCAADLLL